MPAIGVGEVPAPGVEDPVDGRDVFRRADPLAEEAVRRGGRPDRLGLSLDLRPEDRPQVVWQGGKPAFEGDPRGRRRIVQIFRPFVSPWETGGMVS